MSTGTIQDAAPLVITDMRSDALQLSFVNDSGDDLVAGDEVILKTDGTVDKRDAGTELPLGIVIKGAADGERVTVRTPFMAVLKGVANGGTINAGSFVKPNGSKTNSLPQYEVVSANDYALGLVLKGGIAGATIVIGVVDGIFAGGEASAFTAQELAAYVEDDESAAYVALTVTTDPTDWASAAAKADLANLADLDDVNALRVAYENLKDYAEDIAAKLVTAGILTTP